MSLGTGVPCAEQRPDIGAFEIRVWVVVGGGGSSSLAMSFRAGGDVCIGNFVSAQQHNRCLRGLGPQDNKTLTHWAATRHQWQVMNRNVQPGKLTCLSRTLMRMTRRRLVSLAPISVKLKPCKNECLFE